MLWRNGRWDGRHIFLSPARQLLPQLFPTLRLTPNAPLIGPRLNLTSPGLAPRDTRRSHTRQHLSQDNPQTLHSGQTNRLVRRPAVCALELPPSVLSTHRSESSDDKNMSSSAAAFTRASRPLFSSASAAAQTRQAFSRASGFQQAFRSQQRQQWGRRWQSTASAEQQAAQQVGWFKRMWDSPIGFKTVHFWAPVMKVCLLIFTHQPPRHPTPTLLTPS